MRWYKNVMITFSFCHLLYISVRIRIKALKAINIIYTVLSSVLFLYNTMSITHLDDHEL